MAQWFNPLTLKSKQSGGVGSSPGRTLPLERDDKGSRTRLGLLYFCDPSALRQKLHLHIYELYSHWAPTRTATYSNVKKILRSSKKQPEWASYKEDPPPPQPYCRLSTKRSNIFSTGMQATRGLKWPERPLSNINNIEESNGSEPTSWCNNGNWETACDLWLCTAVGYWGKGVSGLLKDFVVKALR